MQHVIVTISGPSRSGKDTLIGHAVDVLMSREPRDTFIRSISSIDEVKDFTAKLGALIGLPSAERRPDNPTTGQRQMWADIKAAVDRGMEWTVRLPFSELEGVNGKTVILYQVREITNIQKIRDRALELGIEHIAVFVHRTDAGRDPHFTPAATTDKYLGDDLYSFDVVVNNSSLDALRTWGDFLALRIAQAFKS